jgi:lysylphosphatidylglycerol synthetase-like protein (DUF2156 family)
MKISLSRSIMSYFTQENLHWAIADGPATQALPELMTYIYTKDQSGAPNGFAALRILGANKGYHLDPYVATPGAPKGITDLLLYGAMSLLNAAKISYLSLGYEPLDDLGDITGIPKVVAKASRRVHKRIFQGASCSWQERLS